MGHSTIESGPSRVMGGKSAALRERAKFKPYDRIRRRQRTPQLPIPPQETLEQDINALLQTAAREQTGRPITQINFLEAQHRALSGMNEEHSSRPMASQVGMTQDQATEETLGSVVFEPQPEITGATDQNSRRQGMTKIQSKREPRWSESVPPNASPDVQVIADATQQDTVTERPSLSPVRESSTLADARTRMDIARSEKRPAERDRSPGRGGASGATKPSRVTIMFRARDEHREWNRLVHKMAVDPSDPAPVERMAAKQARAHKAVYYDQNLRQIHPWTVLRCGD